ncbi:NAD-P-binding protein [Trametes cingulata]|nr:NAD-P-binding protein [Trametes cingulata]
MSDATPLVLVLGATGFTGQSIVDGLLASGNFRIAAMVRPGSVSKPAAQKLRASGVDIRAGELTDSAEALKEILAGVDIVVSAVSAWAVDDQRPLLAVAKELGVKRVVPGDWATPGEKGIRWLHDKKLAVRDYVKELGLHYTFIDVGWWMQGALPLPSNSTAQMRDISWTIYGDGTNKTLLTELSHIGTYVARILADPRTVNQAVIIWEDEPTQLEAHEIGERASGEAETLKTKRIYVSADEIVQRIKRGHEQVAQNPESTAVKFALLAAQYMYSIHILGENSLEAAKRLGYLDVRELYPDVPTVSLEEYAKVFYGDAATQQIHFDRAG